MKSFFAKFKGQETLLKGLVVRPGNLYELTPTGFDSARNWLWVRIDNAEPIPYTEEGLKANWTPLELKEAAQIVPAWY